MLVAWRLVQQLVGPANAPLQCHCAAARRRRGRALSLHLRLEDDIGVVCHPPDIRGAPIDIAVVTIGRQPDVSLRNKAIFGAADYQDVDVRQRERYNVSLSEMRGPACLRTTCQRRDKLTRARRHYCGCCPFRKLYPRVAMVKSAWHSISDDHAGPLDWPTIWSVLVNSEMSPRRVVICGVGLQDMPKMCLTPDDHMVEAFTADRPDRTFDISILPWCSGRDGAIANAHCSKPPSERLAIGTIIVMDEKARNGVPRKGFGNLAGQPFRRRIGRDTESGATRPSVRNIFARDFSLRRVDLPSPPCWISWSR